MEHYLSTRFLTVKPNFSRFYIPLPPSQKASNQALMVIGFCVTWQMCIRRTFRMFNSVIRGIKPVNPGVKKTANHAPISQKS